jgi:hypothetical protein
MGKNVRTGQSLMLPTYGRVNAEATLYSTWCGGFPSLNCRLPAILIKALYACEFRCYAFRRAKIYDEELYLVEYIEESTFWRKISPQVGEYPKKEISIKQVARRATLKVKATCSSETSIDSERTTRRYIPEDITVHNHRFQNLKSYTSLCLH